MIETDVAIIGAGAAGLAAAEAAARTGRKVLVVERLGAGGQVMTVENIANLPEFPQGISGFELGPLLQERAEAAGAQFLLDTVLRLESRDGAHLLYCEAEVVRARAVIVAAGSVRRSLGVPGEEALQGRGVSHCASCDGPLFRGQAVCVVGGGDAGFGEAQVLAGHAASVTIVFREDEPLAQGYLRDAVSALPNVTLVARAEVTAIEGEEGVKAVRIRLGDGTQRSLHTQGVFVCAGLRAASAFLADVLERDVDGRIRTDDACRTSVPGVFAAGDIRAGAACLLASAAAEGAQAAAAALRHLEVAAA